MKYLMGIDCGTGSVRVAIFDLRGQNRAYDIAEYPTTYPQNGWAEQDDKDWYEALKKAIPGAIKKSGVNPDDIVAVTCDATTSTIVFLDENNQSVRKPMLWPDVRAAAEAAEIDKIRDAYPATR
jgi:sugar (pentulose or hexulose) kinase